MASISDIGFRYRKVVLFIVALAMIAGLVRYFTMPSREDPYLVIRTAVVVAEHPGLSPERMETLVARPLEEAVITIPEIKEVLTTVLEGQVIIQVEAYFAAKNLDRVWDELAEAVQAAAPNLPPTMGAVVVDDEFGDVAVVTAALTTSDFTMAELFDYAQYARDRLIGVEGTRRVEIVGAPSERIYLRVSDTKLASAGVSAADIRDALQARNILTSGGDVILSDRRYLVEPTGLLQSVSDIEDTLIRSAGRDTPIALSEVASVERSYADPPERLAYFNGDPAIVLTMVQNVNQSAIDYGDRALQRLDEIQSELPVGIDLDTITVQKRQVESAVYGVSFSVLQTLLVVSVVVIIFLGLRTGLVVGSIVPVVVLLTIAGMSVWGIPLQRMSLATIVIALGLLVDNGIVVAEDFKRRLGEDVERRDAISQTGRELALPLLSSSLTTMVFFLPLALAPNSSSEYTRSIAQVIVLSLSISWVIAMTVTPILCYWFVKPPRASQGEKPRMVQRGFDWLETRYEKLLLFILRGRWIFMGLVAAAFAGGVWLMGQIPAQFFPNSDREQVLVYIDLPEGVSTLQTDAAMQTALETVADRDRFPDFRDAAGYVGFGGPRFVLSLQPVDPGRNVGFVVVNIDGLDNVTEHIGELQSALETELPDVFIRVTKMFLGPSDPNVIQVQVKGPDASHINEMGRRIQAIMMDQEGADYAWSDWYNPTSKLVVDVDERRARLVGLTSSDIAAQTALLTEGAVITSLYDGDEKIPVYLRARDEERRSVDNLANLTISPPGAAGVGNEVRLGNIADIRSQSQYGRIQREDLVRTVTIEGRNTLTSPEDLVPLLDGPLNELREDLLPGHTIEYDGAVGESAESQGAIASQAPLALGIIVILLLMQFNSFRNLGIILSILPLSIIGAAIGLYLMGAPFGFMVILGLFALFGIIVNNAIVLIDRIQIEIDAQAEDGEDDDPTHDTNADNRLEAVLSASGRRLRPILITTVTTILGLLPLIIGQDVLFYGMAVVIAFGLAVGTILTLGVVPVLYTLFFRIDVSQDADIDRESDDEMPDGAPA